MNTPGLIKFASGLAALALCSACTALPFDSAQGRLAQGDANLPAAASRYQYDGKMLIVNGRPVTAARLSPMPRYAMLVPEAHSSAKTYEYIINDYGTYSSIFDYPKSTQEIGQIAGDGGQGCTDVLYGYGKKTFWDIGGYNLIREYRVPEKTLKTLTDAEGEPSSCAMNSSGDLAVGILYGSYGGDVLIFKNATGTPIVYSTPLVREYMDGYDNKGNLFADGLTNSYNFALIELPKGSSKFVTIATSNTVEFPGSVQWDGTYLTVFDQLTSETYQYTVSGTKATLKHTIMYSGSGDCAQTWIVKGLVYCADAGNNNGEVFKYPAGGSIVATFNGNFDLPLGTVASRK